MPTMGVACNRWTHNKSQLAWSESWCSVCIHHINRVNSCNDLAMNKHVYLHWLYYVSAEVTWGRWYQVPGGRRCHRHHRRSSRCRLHLPAVTNTGPYSTGHASRDRLVVVVVRHHSDKMLVSIDTVALHQAQLVLGCGRANHLNS